MTDEQRKTIIDRVDEVASKHPLKDIIEMIALEGWEIGLKIAKQDNIPEDVAWFHYKRDVLEKIGDN